MERVKVNLPQSKQHLGNNGNIIELKDVPDILPAVSQIRRDRIGYRLKIGDSIITTQFISSYTQNGYSEQVFVLTNKSAYKDILEAFLGLSPGETKNSFLEPNIIGETEDNWQIADHTVSLNSNTLNLYQDQNQDPNTAARMISKRGRHENFVSTGRKRRRTDETRPVSNPHSTPRKALCPEQIRARLLSIPLLAEGVRYPPMIFYGLVALHNIFLGYVTNHEIERDILSIKQSDGYVFPSTISNSSRLQNQLELSGQDENPVKHAIFKQLSILRAKSGTSFDYIVKYYMNMTLGTNVF